MVVIFLTSKWYTPKIFACLTKYYLSYNLKIIEEHQFYARFCLQRN